MKILIVIDFDINYGQLWRLWKHLNILRKVGRIENFEIHVLRRIGAIRSKGMKVTRKEIKYISVDEHIYVDKLNSEFIEKFDRITVFTIDKDWFFMKLSPKVKLVYVVRKTKYAKVKPITNIIEIMKGYPNKDIWLKIITKVFKTPKIK